MQPFVAAILLGVARHNESRADPDGGEPEAQAGEATRGGGAAKGRAMVAQDRVRQSIGLKTARKRGLNRGGRGPAVGLAGEAKARRAVDDRERIARPAIPRRELPLLVHRPEAIRLGRGQGPRGRRARDERPPPPRANPPGLVQLRGDRAEGRPVQLRLVVVGDLPQLARPPRRMGEPQLPKHLALVRRGGVRAAVRRVGRISQGARPAPPESG